VKTAFVCISDIHIRGGEGDNPIFDRFGLISSALIEQIDICDQFVFLNIGDTAFSGKKSEYEVFDVWLSRVFSEIEQVTGKKPAYTFFTPGNHDCEIPVEASRYRKTLIDLIFSQDSDMYAAEMCLAAQNNYFSYIKKYEQSELTVEQKIYRAVNLDISGVKISLHIFNSSWLCERYDSQGRLIIPESIMSADIDDSNLSISILHHPFNWIDSSNYKALMSYIGNISDIVITGHEHVEGTTMISTSGVTINQLESGALQSHNLLESSKFQIIVFDDVQKSITRKTYSVGQEVSLLEYESVYIPSISTRNRLQTKPKPQFIRDLTSDSFDNILSVSKMSEVFILPPIKQILEEENIEYDDYNEFLELVCREDKIVLYGNSLSGKSFILKKVADDLISKNYLLVFIQNGDLKSDSDERINRQINAFIQGNYEITLENAWGIEKSRRAIIIDDFHMLKIGKTRAAEFLRHIEEKFGKVIISTNEGMLDSAIIMKRYGIEVFNQYRKLQISPLSNVSRLKLIELWHSVKYKDDIGDSQELYKAQHIVDNILSTNPFPAYPIFVLSLLKKISVEGEVVHEKLTSQIYDSLIDIQIGSISQKIIDYPSLVSILADIANEITKTRDEALSKTDLLRVLGKYEERIGIRIDKERIINELVENRVFEVNEGLYSFKFKYTFYFSIARHLEDILQSDSEEYASEKETLLDRIYEDRNSNILLFTLYTSRNKSLIQDLINKANATLTSFSNIIDLTKLPSTKEIEQDLKLYYTESEVSDNRMSLAKSKDDIDKIKVHKTQSDGHAEDPNADSDENSQRDDIYKDPEYIDVISTRPIINIIGQILKSESGRLDAQLKIEALSAVYNLTIRWLNYFIKHSAKLVDVVIDAIKKSDKINVEDHEKIVRLLGNLYLSLMVSFIRESTTSSATNRLEIIYDQISSMSNSIEFDILNFSSQLDALRVFPRQELTRLIDKSTKRSEMYVNILRLIVLYKAYYSGIDYRTQREVFAQLKIASRKKIIRTS
jgi:hypothetical protein